MSNRPETPYSLLGRLCDGSARRENSWEQFVKTYGPVILDSCRRRGLQPSDAEDVAQEVLQKLVRGIRNYRRDKGRFRAYLETIVHNEVGDFFRGLERRKDRARGGDDADDRLANCPDPSALEAQLLSAFHADLVQEAWRRLACRLNDKHLAVFRRLVVDEVNSAEVAREFDFTVGTVYKIKLAVKTAFDEELERLNREGPGAATV